MNKTGMELSINMIVVIILGLVMLGAGIAIFNNGFGSAVELRDEMSQQQQLQLNRLLDDGSSIVIPFTVKEAKRGEHADFDIGISNELNAGTIDFYIYVSLDDSNPTGSRALFSDKVLYVNNGDAISLGNNDRHYEPVRIIVDRKVPKGQYIFNVDICYDGGGKTCNDDNNGAMASGNRLGSRQKIYVTV
jgi:hypothetical protein